MDRIKSKGDDFCTRIFENVKSFQAAIFETIIWFYDPNFAGILENIEREIDRTLCEKIVKGQVYFIMLVFSRIKNIERDKELRFKVQALQEASLKHLGVNQYLLLND